MKRKILMICLCILVLAFGIYIIVSMLSTDTVKGDAKMTLENRKSIISIDETTGQLQQIINKSSDKIWDFKAISKSEISIDLDNSDIWKTEPFSGTNLNLGPKDGEISFSKRKNTLTVRTLYVLEDGEIETTKVYTLEGNKLDVDFEVDNRLKTGVVLSARPCDLTGIAQEQEFSLLWPNKEGEIHVDAINRMAQGELSPMWASYPVPFSMQYVSLFNDEESLYYGIHDASATHKEFEFKRDDNGVMLGSSQWLFAGPSDKKQTATTVISTQDQGGFTSAADVYKEFLVDESGWVRNQPDIVKDFVGWYPTVMATHNHHYKLAYVKGSPSNAWATMKNANSMGLKQTGIPMTLYLGWHVGGFDARYPDYEFDEALGGEEGFAQAISDIHDQGGQVMMYFNNHIANVESNWYQSLTSEGEMIGLSSAIKSNAKGGIFREDYGTGLDYVAMCPASEPWIEALEDGINRVRKHGVDGIWLDQMMEMPSALCFDASHGHSTPATAFSEGYEKMMTRLNAVMEQEGSNYLYGTEGVCDAYIQWVDISGMMWARKLGFSEETAPETTRYTLPTKILGLPGDKEFGREEYARAFLMGEPFLITENINPILKDYVELYQSYPDIFLQGHYLHHGDIEGLGDTLMMGVMTSETKTRYAIQLFNPSKEEITVTLTLPSKPVTVVYEKDGTEMPLSKDELEITLTGNEIATYIVNLKK